MPAPGAIGSICLYCASSDAADLAFMEAAAAFGVILAREGVRLVYGGGKVGLMGACARACHAAGGRVLGVMPDFLKSQEILYEAVDTIVVRSMHERKMRMFEEADAFAVLPGGVGTLEEIVELLSWRRLELHRKPIVFLNPGGFWDHLFAFLHQAVALNLAPAALETTWRTVTRVEDLLPAMHEMTAEQPPLLPKLMPRAT
ncbi:MAG TPA: TIGR00730 family Rossman fold protein [Caulobacteraceae bacterium]|nr:TIGR00730 family Rossman fold protein [Caulobacteraceae bacterium]